MLAVSGGSDSIALMRLARCWSQAWHPALILSVLTVDHGLREQSAAEAAAVGEQARALGLAHHTLRWDGEKPRTGLQASARAARYGLMADWCRAHEAGVLLTAHTLDDQAETVLMRLSRTASPGSIAGIAERGVWQALPLLRPLLRVRRQALRDYLAASGVAWIEDPSNDDTRFERVRARQLLGQFEAEGMPPGRFAALAEAGARASGLLSHCAGRWLARWLQEEDAGVCQFAIEPFRPLPPLLQQAILARIVGHYGGGAAPEPDELRRLSRWVAEGGPVRCTLGGAILGRRKGLVWVTREEARISPEPLIIREAGEALWDGRFMVKAPPGTRVRASAGRPTPWPRDVPSAARRSFPLAEPPEAASGPVSIAFRRLVPS